MSEMSGVQSPPPACGMVALGSGGGGRCSAGCANVGTKPGHPHTVRISSRETRQPNAPARVHRESLEMLPSRSLESQPMSASARKANDVWHRSPRVFRPSDYSLVYYPAARFSHAVTRALGPRGRLLLARVGPQARSHSPRVGPPHGLWSPKQTKLTNPVLRYADVARPTPLTFVLHPAEMGQEPLVFSHSGPGGCETFWWQGTGMQGAKRLFGRC